MYLGDDSPVNIIGHGRVKLKLKDGRIRSLPGVLHIPNLARNLIYVGKMDVADVKTMCGDGGCKMVRINGIDEGCSVWNSIQTIGKNHH